MSKIPEPEQAHQGDNRRTQQEEVSKDVDITHARKEISPKLYGKSAGQDPGVLEDLLLIDDARSTRDQDTSHPSQEEQPVFPALNLPTSSSSASDPHSRQTDPNQSLPLPTKLLSSYKEQNGPNLQQVDSLTSSSDGSIARDTSRSSSDTTDNGVADPMSNKYPTQVEDDEEQSWSNKGQTGRVQVESLLSPFQASLPGEVDTNAQYQMMNAGCFPQSDYFLKYPPGRLIYSVDENFVPDVLYLICEYDKLRLGSGGNSDVFSHYRNGKLYAVKKSKYQQDMLNIWSLLNHTNIVPLLGVVIGQKIEEIRYCYQIMPQISGDLRSIITTGDIYTCLQRNIEHICLALHNITYIIKEVLKGLVELDMCNIHHGDIKADNILLDLNKKCFCGNVLLCKCCYNYSIYIADFGSSNRFPPKEAEIFRNKLHDGKTHYNLVGPWSDIWDLGAMLMELVLGSDNLKTCIQEARALTSQNDQVDPDSGIRRIATKLLHCKLLELGRNSPGLELIINITNYCLEVDVAKRLTASKLLSLK